MMFLTPKIKILIVLAVAGAGCVIGYWVWLRVRSSLSNRTKESFSIPSDRVAKKVLENGMEILVFQNKSLPKVLVQIAYDVGSYVEETGERGLAHLVEHMIFKGTEKLSETDIDGIARKYGASFNAFTSMDMTSYYFETNKNNWKPFIPLLADCMQNARFDAQHLASEVKAVIQELKMGKDNYWRTMILKACEFVFPPNHPYHTPTIGFKEDLLNLNAESLKLFYKKYYRPDRATLFIVGDVDLNEAVAYATEHFEHITADEKSVIKSFPNIIPEIMTNHTRYFEDVAHEQLGFYWVVPGLKSSYERIMSVIDTVLGGGQSGRLYRLLVDEKKVATSVYVKASTFMEAGVFLILIEPIAGKADLCAQLVAQELERMTDNGIEQAELDQVIKQRTRSFFQKMQDYSEFAYDWIQTYFATRNELYIFEKVNAYSAVSNQDIKAFVKHFLDPFLMNRIEVLPIPAAKRPLQEMIKNKSDEMDKKILALHVRTAPVEEPRALLTIPDPEDLAFVFPKPARIIECSNGLRVLLAPSHEAPLIAFNCQFKEASLLDDVRDGIRLEFMMDMLMEGSKGYSKKQNVDFFEQRGASYALDKKGARFVCLKQDFNHLVEHLHHVMTMPTFPHESQEKLRQLFVDTFQRAKDSPRSMAVRILKNMIYKDHPFAWTYDEAISLVESCHDKDFKSLHEAFVCPANMIISVTGDFDCDAMESQIRKVFSSWSTGTTQTILTGEASFKPRETLDYTMVRDQAMLLIGQPSPLTVYDSDLVPLKLLNIIAFYSLGSRIYKLREQTGLFYSAFGAFASGATKVHGFDFAGMLVSPENLDTAEKQLRALITTLATEGVTLDELKAARQLYLKDLIDLVSDNMSIARLLATLDSLGLGFDYYDNVLSRVQSIEVQELNRIAGKYCLPDAMGRVRVGRV